MYSSSSRSAVAFGFVVMVIAELFKIVLKVAVIYIYSCVPCNLIF